MRETEPPGQRAEIRSLASRNWRIASCRLPTIAEGATNGSRTHTAPRAMSAQASADRHDSCRSDPPSARPKASVSRTGPNRLLRGQLTADSAAGTVNRPGVSGGLDVPWVSRSRVAGLWSCYGLGLAGSQFVFDRREHAERGMTPPPVVEDLQVFEQGVGELDTGCASAAG